MRFFCTTLRSSLAALAASGNGKGCRSAAAAVVPRHLHHSTSSSTCSSIPLVHSSFRDVVDRYDAFILDQFGVLHNGVNALPGAIDCVAHLAERNIKLIILSNTSAPASHALSKLPKLGFVGDHLFVDAVTSGEEASRYIRVEYGSGARTSKAIFITWNTDIPDNPRLTAPPQAFLDQCGNVAAAENLDEADLVILHGSEVWYRGDAHPVQSLDFIETGDMTAVVNPLLDQFLERNLPLICANPDHVVVTPSGGTAHMPGSIAQQYRAIGGSVKMFGKPDVEHFDACIRKLSALGIPKHRVAHVGDSLHHDIAGANAAGISNVFVSSGIHGQALGIDVIGEMPEAHTLERLFHDEGIFPTHVVPAFCL
jgi:HAD superfamily hydrolase (TIGR01459 family)